MEGAGLVPWLGGPMDAYLGVIQDKHSNARPTQKDITQRELLGTDMLQQLYKITELKNRSCGGWFPPCCRW